MGSEEDSNTRGAAIVGGVSVVSRPGAILLTAVAAVLVFVSVPHMEVYARSENEADARTLVGLLRRECAQSELEWSAGLSRHLDLERLAGRLQDGRWSGDGSVLQRHGYLFDLHQDGEGQRWLRARPLAPGASGTSSFFCSIDAGDLRVTTPPSRPSTSAREGS